ncbi:MAG: FAD-dependent oxidoreductase [Alphaproteobacteria bacterium]|nr:FAD-dependent oxidoreductase [Alphaproteobacteria bacterium]
MSEVNSTCHIIGAGLSGLMCAFFLRRQGNTHHIVLYDDSSSCGGQVATFYHQPWGIRIDNAPHIIVSSNEIMREFVHDDEWEKNVLFVDSLNQSLSTRIDEHQVCLLRKICNSDLSEVSEALRRKLTDFVFPSRRYQPKFYTSSQNLDTRIINMLRCYGDVINHNCRLTSVDEIDGRVSKLNFGRRSVKLAANDMVILALDNAQTAKILRRTPLEKTSFITVSYYTSQRIFVPHNTSFVGIEDGAADWLVITPNVVTAFVFGKAKSFSTSDKLALHIWDEICRIRGVNSAFVPAYKVDKHTGIELSDVNNERRPKDARTQYQNLFICGDWTMRDYPCCMEAAALSAVRAVETLLKSTKQRKIK